MKGRLYVISLVVMVALMPILKFMPIKAETDITNDSGYSVRYIPNKSSYIVDLYNEGGEIVYSIDFSEEPRLSKSGDTIIINSGGGNVTQIQFFDTTHATLSKVFEAPLETWEDKIAYMAFKDGETVLVIQNIYNADILYSEFHNNFSITANPADAILNFELLNDNAAKITYLSGERFTETETEIFW